MNRSGTFDIPEAAEKALILPLGDIAAGHSALNILLSTGQPLAEPAAPGGKLAVGVRWLSVCERADLEGRLAALERANFLQAQLAS